MGVHEYASGNVPCYSQFGVLGPMQNALATTGAGLCCLLGFQDYMQYRPATTAASVLEERVAAFRGPNAALSVTVDDVGRDAEELEMQCRPIRPDRIAEHCPCLVLVARWPELVPIGPLDHWIIVRAMGDTHVEIGDPCFQGLGADWAARRWTPDPPPPDPSIYGAVRRIPLTRFVPLLAEAAAFRLVPA